ncbi:MAG: hypothetical protein IAX21_02200 [Candidatus Bathyarchaeota archaeon]|nr:MAG: hypothetical protein IAX21_02200 [Candidatus Bathyarchaeota archaeon]
MRINPLVLLVAVNVLIIGFCGVLVYSDLNMREYDIKNHLSTRVVLVEYSILSYRPTYQYFDIKQQQVIVTEGSWTLDYLQVSSLFMAVVDIRWIFANKQKLGLTD